MKRKKKPGPLKGTRFSDVRRSPIGARLFTTRRARGLSQEELGKRVGISKRMIAHYESSQGDPSIETLQLLASALKVTVSYLTGESAQKSIKDELSPKMRRHLEKLQKLPVKDQQAVLRMVDALAAQSGVSNEQKDTPQEQHSS